MEGARRDLRRRPQVPPTTQLPTTDVVVAADGTFPTMAIAQGVPTVMYSQFVVALGLRGDEIVIPNRVPLYQTTAATRSRATRATSRT